MSVRCTNLSTHEVGRYLRGAIALSLCVLGLGVPPPGSAVRAGEVRGADEAGPPRKKPGRDIDNWGRLGSSIKGTEDFFRLTYYEKDKKGKLKPKKALLQVPAATPLFLDKQIRIEDLAADETVHIFGRSVEREVPSRRGGGGGGGGLGGQRRGTDRQIQNARVVLAGKEIETNERHKDPEDAAIKWHKADVNMSSSGLWVKCDGNEYRVTLGRGAPVFRRTECERKLVKSGMYVYVIGKKTQPPAEASGKKKAEQLAFKASRIVFIDPRYLKTAYAAVLP